MGDGNEGDWNGGGHREEARDARAGFDRYGVRGDKDYRGEVYRARDAAPRDRPAGGGAVGVNPALDRVADDDLTRGWRPALGRGEGPHRGRGPRSYVRADARIHEDVCDALCEDPRLDASDVEVAVTAGEVSLSGEVRARDDKRRAEDLAWAVSGVKQVRNGLRVEAAASGRPV